MVILLFLQINQTAPNEAGNNVVPGGFAKWEGHSSSIQIYIYIYIYPSNQLLFRIEIIPEPNRYLWDL
jgi:hypothetical protein